MRYTSITCIYSDKIQEFFVPLYCSMDQYPKYNRIADVLKQKHKSQRWLAEQLGISSNALNNLCTQKSQSLQKLFEIADILGVDVCELINRENPTHGK